MTIFGPAEKHGQPRIAAIQFASSRSSQGPSPQELLGLPGEKSVKFVLVVVWLESKYHSYCMFISRT
jgi:hypothetical protein